MRVMCCIELYMHIDIIYKNTMHSNDIVDYIVRDG